MEGFPDTPFALDDWLLSWAKRISIGALRGLEIIVCGTGALVMLVVIVLAAAYEFFFG